MDNRTIECYLFAWQRYYPEGGLRDLKAECFNLNHAISNVARLALDSQYEGGGWQICDYNLKVICEGEFEDGDAWRIEGEDDSDQIKTPLSWQGNDI